MNSIKLSISSRLGKVQGEEIREQKENSFFKYQSYPYTALSQNEAETRERSRASLYEKDVPTQAWAD